MTQVHALSDFVHDLRFAVRQLRRHRAFTVIAVATLAIGIGATSTLFSVLNAVVLEPLPYPESGRLVDIATEWQNSPGAISVGNYFVIRERARSFDSIAARSGATFNLAEDGEPERVQGARISASYFRVLGIRPVLGRAFTEAEDAPEKPRLALIGQGLFARRFGSDPGLIGHTLRLSGVPHTVVGVMPADFAIPGDETQIWAPIAFRPEHSFDAHYLTVTARLKRGVSPEHVAEDIRSITAAIREAAPRDNEGRTLLVVRLIDRLVGDYGKRLSLLLAAVSLVFLIACVNVASLLMARGASRKREMAVRAALGAGRYRIARQLLTEALLLCLVGALLGLILAGLALPIITALGPADVPRLSEARISGPVLIATTVLTFAALLIAGLAPAFREPRAGLGATAGLASRGSTGFGRDRVRQAFVATEVALALMLLMSAGLLIRSGLNLGRVSPGFDAENLLAARLALPTNAYPGEEKPAAAVALMVANLATQPGVVEAAASTRPPLIGDVSYGLRVEGRDSSPQSRINGRMQLVTTNYLEVMRVPIRAGRAFTPGDDRGAVRVIIVSETLARLAWPNRSAIGKRLACCEGDADHPAWKEVVGVVADTRARSLASPGIAEFYLPMDQARARSFEANAGSITILARAKAGNAEALGPEIRSAVHSVDGTLPLYDIATMASRVAASTAATHFNRLLLSCLAVVGLGLAVVGIYGVVAYLAEQRTREISVRMALGAGPREVMALVIGQGLGPISAGLGLGSLGVLAQSRALEVMVFGVSGLDPWTFGSVVVLLLAVAMGASALPAWRASRTDPARALSEA